MSADRRWDPRNGERGSAADDGIEYSLDAKIEDSEDWDPGEELICANGQCVGVVPVSRFARGSITCCDRCAEKLRQRRHRAPAYFADNDPEAVEGLLDAALTPESVRAILHRYDEDDAQRPVVFWGHSTTKEIADCLREDALKAKKRHDISREAISVLRKGDSISLWRSRWDSGD